MSNLKLCLAVPTYNRCDLVGKSIDSIFRAEVPPEISRIRLLVINNNCTDATQETVDQKIGTGPFELRQIYEETHGLCYCRNRAIQEAHADDFVVLLDDDIQLHSRWLRGLVNCINEFGADCVVGPVHAQFTGPLPSFMTEMAIRSISSPYSLRGSMAFRLPDQLAHEIPGCNFAVSVAAANAVGGFNNSLDRLGKELVAGGDFDFGHRLRKAGFSVCYHPDCGIDHVISSEKLTREYMLRRWRYNTPDIRPTEQKSHDFHSLQRETSSNTVERKMASYRRKLRDILRRST